MKKTLLWISKLFFIPLIIGGFAQAQVNISYNDFLTELVKMDISIQEVLSKENLSRYEIARLLNVVECQDCVHPSFSMSSKYNQAFWKNFSQLPGKDFGDIQYNQTPYQGDNYFYCVAYAGDQEYMKGYPVATSPVCGGSFCGDRALTRAEFYQTLSNILAPRIYHRYSFNWDQITRRFDKQSSTSYSYKMFTETEIARLGEKKRNPAGLSQTIDLEIYMKYCMFNLNSCNYDRYVNLQEGVWPIAQINLLIKEGVLTPSTVANIHEYITPEEALQQLYNLYRLHTQCYFDDDYDCDGIPNTQDNCPYDFNPSQRDSDGDKVGDVCDDDIDGDGIKNPIGIVDETGNINMQIFASQGSPDKTPLGEPEGEIQAFIEVVSISDQAPAIVKFQIKNSANIRTVERDFGDFAQGKGTSTQHIYHHPGTYPVLAKLTTQGGKSVIAKTEIYIGESSDRNYFLALELEHLDTQQKTASLIVKNQGKYDSRKWSNSALNLNDQKTKVGDKLTIPLLEGEKNTIVLKAYFNDQLVAVASTDIAHNGKFFFHNSLKINPGKQTLGEKVSFNNQLYNLAFGKIRTMRWDFGDQNTRFNTSSQESHNYKTIGSKFIAQTIETDDHYSLSNTATITFQDPEKVQSRANNLWMQSDIKGNINIYGKTLGQNSNKIDLNVSFSDGGNLYAPGLNPQGFQLNYQTLYKGMLKADFYSYQGSSAGFNHFGQVNIKDDRLLNLSTIDTQKLFASYKCDLDQDAIPDMFDNDIDGDGIRNLLGMILYEKPDCSLIVGDNVDEELYLKHFGICSLDNCPFSYNPDQSDLNLNGIGDICESNLQTCGNGIVDPGEDCKNCPQDVKACTAFCGNEIAEEAETCTNCPEDVPICKATTCGNGKIDPGEQCDNGNKNGNDGKCSLLCTIIDPKLPSCGNGIVDPGEDCSNCSVDLQDRCIDEGDKNKDPFCGNGKIDPGEDCKNCLQDVKACTAFCGNEIAEEAETCTNCPEDVPICKATTCGNGKIDPGEQCDNGNKNGNDGKCSLLCTIIDPKLPSCGNGIVDPGEDCSNCSVDLQDRCIDEGETEKEQLPSCGNGIVDPGEDCKNCPQDVKACTAFCGNGITEEAETCQNCPEDVPICKATTCGNGKIDPGEQCDNGNKNGNDGKCSLLCSIIDPKLPTCGNGIVNPGEDCSNCSVDLQDRCIGEGDKNKDPFCGNGKIDPGEDCKNCPQDVGTCSAFCGNGIVEDAETCTNCPEDVPICAVCGDGKIDPGENCLNCPKDVGICSASCGNGKVELAENCLNCPEDIPICNICGNSIKDLEEECDNGTMNGKDGICTQECTWTNPQLPSCGNGVIDLGEDCQNCPEDLKDICIDKGDKKPDNCGNGDIDPGETCQNCSIDLKDICVTEGEKMFCGNGKIESGEECDNGAMNGKDGKCSESCKKIIPKCGDGLGFSKDCPPPPPPPCEGDECLLITPECLQCPCQYADYGNILNRNDDVRAKIWDQDFQVIYDLSPFVSIERYLKKR